MSVRADLFFYDPSAPLRFSVEDDRILQGVTVAEVRYDNGTGGEVEALAVASPRPRNGRHGVVIAHGGFEGGKHLFLEQAVELCRSGFTVLVPDTTFPRSGTQQRSNRLFELVC